MDPLEPRRLFVFVPTGASTINGDDFQSVDRIVALPSGGYVAAGMFSQSTEFTRGVTRSTKEKNTDVFLQFVDGNSRTTLTLGSSDKNKLKFADDRVDFAALPRRVTDVDFALGVSASIRQADEYISQVKLGPDGKLYVAIVFRKNISLDTQSSTGKTLAVPDEFEDDYFDSAILRYNIGGGTFALEDVKQITGPFNDVIEDFTFDTTGNLIVAGSFERGADFDPSKKQRVIEPNGRGDAFVAKYGRSGKLQWVSQLGGDADHTNEIEAAFSVAAGPNDTIYVGGTVAGDAEFRINSGSAREDVVESDDATDGFTMKLDTNGGLEWVRSQGGDDFDGVRAVTPAPDGGVWNVGYFSDDADLDPSANVQIFSANDRDDHSDTPTDGFFTRFDKDGNVLFVKPLSGDGYELIANAQTSSDGGLIIAGSFSGHLDADPSKRVRMLTTPDSDNDDLNQNDRDFAYAGFLLTYSPEAKLRKVQQITGDSGQDVFILGAQQAADGSIALAGRYRGGFSVGSVHVRTNTDFHDYREDGFSLIVDDALSPT
jgi:hypothetical protein